MGQCVKGGVNPLFLHLHYPFFLNSMFMLILKFRFIDVSVKIRKTSL